MTPCIRSTLASVLVAVPILFTSPTAFSAGSEALIVKSSPHDVPTTVQRIEAAVKSRGAAVVAKVDHAAGAAASGLSLPPTVLVLFGNPKLGTPLMQSQPTAGLDLPLRILVWRDARGTTQVGYAPPQRIAARHGITDRGDVIEKMNGAISGIAAEATAP